MHIVIIEDEAAVAETLAEAVRGQGHTASVGRTGKEGLALLAEHTPDAVFLDLVMPGLSGVELLREIRRDKPELPIVVVTGWAGPEQLDEARRLGVTDIVEKPWALKYMGEALRNLGAEKAGPRPERLLDTLLPRIAGMGSGRAEPGRRALDRNRKWGQDEAVPALASCALHELTRLMQERHPVRGRDRVAAGPYAHRHDLSPSNEAPPLRHAGVRGPVQYLRKHPRIRVHQEQAHHTPGQRRAEVGAPKLSQGRPSDGPCQAEIVLRILEIGGEADEGHAVAETVRPLELEIQEVSEEGGRDGPPGRGNASLGQVTHRGSTNASIGPDKLMPKLPRWRGFYSGI